jgi:hypothetical protein
LRADGCIIRVQAMIRADGHRPRKIGEGPRVARADTDRVGFATRGARQPRSIVADAAHPQQLNAVSGKSKTGLPPDRRLCTDGFIIRAQAVIGADGFRPRKSGEGLCVAGKGLRAARELRPVWFWHPLRGPTTSKFCGCCASTKFERGF